MFIRFREKTATRHSARGWSATPADRECVGRCQQRRRHYPRYGIGMNVEGRTFLEGCPMRPICPLKEQRRRLEVSIVETRREGGRVKHRHIASLGSIADDTIEAREIFWRECEDRLARLGNKLGPDIDPLRQAIAARIPPPTDLELTAATARRWDRLENGWDEHAKKRARDAVDRIETARRWAKELQHEAAMAEAVTRQTKRLRGNEKAYDPLNMLLGTRLIAPIVGSDGETEARLIALIDAEENGR
jgi:hypothetical protein